jgi:hypothetical protein
MDMSKRQHAMLRTGVLCREIALSTAHEVNRTRVRTRLSQMMQRVGHLYSRTNTGAWKPHMYTPLFTVVLAPKLPVVVSPDIVPSVCDERVEVTLIEVEHHKLGRARALCDRVVGCHNCPPMQTQLSTIARTCAASTSDSLTQA